MVGSNTLRSAHPRSTVLQKMEAFTLLQEVVEDMQLRQSIREKAQRLDLQWQQVCSSTSFLRYHGHVEETRITQGGTL